MPHPISILKDLSSLFFPHTCCGCGSDALGNENLLCARCEYDLPFTEYEQYEDNPLERVFFGRVGIHRATATLYYNKGQLVQRLIGALKYKQNKEMGILLGKIMGEALLKSSWADTVDVIIPLPLFHKKEYRRGYNQSEVICRGMSQVMNLSLSRNNVIRTKETETQTKKHRTERIKNVDGVFIVKDPASLQNKHVLLVDDVITTGATMESCALALLQIPGIRVSLAAVATASH